LPDPIEPVASVERVREGGSERRGFVGLDRNERVGPLPAWFLDKVRSAVDSRLLTDYPAVDELESELAAATGLSPEQLLVTPGSDPVFKALYHVYVRPGDGAVMLDPSYAMYAVYARMFGARAVGIPFDRELEPDVELLLGSIRPGVRLVLLANPNQPTGTLLPDDVVRAALERAAEAGALVVVDEAYSLFSGTTVLSLLDDWPNLVVARSFSKAGFAGVRVGFVAAGPEVRANLFRVRSAADVSSFAVLCARLLVAHPEVAEDYATEVHDARAVVEERSRALGLKPLASHANFTLIRVEDVCEPRALVAALRERGFLVKGPFRDACLADCVRVTLGPPALMEEFAEALGDAVADCRT
jgi:histidinol-phosphate aminotransferase